MAPLVLAFALLQFTGPTGKRIDVNQDAVSTVREPGSLPKGHFGHGTHCIIVTTNGAFVAVAETCPEVRAKLGQPTGPCVLVCGAAPTR